MHQDLPSLQQQKLSVSRSYFIGICFIISVSIIWAASSVLIQYIYNDKNNTFQSPFLVTYIGVSLFTLWLPTQRVVHCFLQQRYATTTANERYRQNSRIEYESIPLENMNHDSNQRVGDDIDNDNDVHHGGIIVTSSTTTMMDDETATIDDTASNDNDVQQHQVQQHQTQRTNIWTEYDHICAAVCIAPVWFIANWSYNASLIYTSITSSTVLASTGSLFTYLFAIVTNDEQLNTMKFIGVLIGVLGSCITTLSDTTTTTTNTGNAGHMNGSNSDDTAASMSPSASSPSSMLPMLGDILGLVSAIGYGAYAVQTRIYCPKDESLYSMQTLLGYIGLCNFVVLSPLALYLLISGQSQLTWLIVGFLVLKGLFDNVLSDYLWLRAVILTNATTATVGLGLTIPLAFASDIMLGKQGVVSTEQIVGAITVLIGFVLVNLGNHENDATTSTTATGATNDIDSVDESDFSNTSNQRSPPYLDDNISQRGQETVNLPTVS